MNPGDAHDVVVVGGGPAGSGVAHFLARSGLDVLLLDKAHFPRDKPCAEYLSPQSGRILSELGVLTRLESLEGAALSGMRIIAPDGTAFTGSFAARHGFRGFRDQGLAIRRTVLDATLLDAARGAGAMVCEGAAVRDLARDGRRVGGVTAMVEGRERQFRARLVIGADGLRTVVGRRAGLVRTGRWPRRYAMVTHFAGVDGMDDVGEMHVAPGGDGYVGLAPVGGGLTNVAVVVPAARAGAVGASSTDGPADFLAAWLAARPALAPRFARAVRVGPVLVTGPFNSRAQRATAAGLALVGDAADFFDPFTGEGIYSALRGAEMLSYYATEGLRSREQHLDDALDAYDRARRDEFGGKWRVERLVGMAVGLPALMNLVARRLAARRDLADLLVGVAGDFVPARQVLRARFVLQLLGWGRRSDESPDAQRSERGSSEPGRAWGAPPRDKNGDPPSPPCHPLPSSAPIPTPHSLP